MRINTFVFIAKPKEILIKYRKVQRNRTEFDDLKRSVL